MTTYRYETQTRKVVRDLGYSLIPICRPKFIFFEFAGLRPNTPHWLFFDGVDVTKWVNTSYTLDDYSSAARNSVLRTTGDEYVSSTSFPVALGGPTAPTGPINSDATGTIEGVFYLQSNAQTSFPTGKRELVAMDISVLNKSKCLSYAQAVYSAIGEYEIWTDYTETYQVQVAIPDPAPVPSKAPAGNNGGDRGGRTSEPVMSVDFGNGRYGNAYSVDQAVSLADRVKSQGAKSVSYSSNNGGNTSGGKAGSSTSGGGYGSNSRR